MFSPGNTPAREAGAPSTDRASIKIGDLGGSIISTRSRLNLHPRIATWLGNPRRMRMIDNAGLLPMGIICLQGGQRIR
jgi:hypothetical protein